MGENRKTTKRGELISMSALNEYLQTFVNDLQPLLNAHQDNEGLITAAKEKWPDENDLRRNFVIACQTEVNPLRGKKGLPGLIDTGGGDDDGGRENEPVGRR
jgi:hypothetical protein